MLARPAVHVHPRSASEFRRLGTMTGGADRASAGDAGADVLPIEHIVRDI